MKTIQIVRPSSGLHAVWEGSIRSDGRQTVGGEATLLYSGSLENCCKVVAGFVATGEYEDTTRSDVARV